MYFHNKNCISFHLGATSIGQCPKEQYIPIYLTIFGAFGLLRILIELYNQIIRIDDKYRKQAKTKTDKQGTYTSIPCGENDISDVEATKRKEQTLGERAKKYSIRLLDVFLVAWFGAGNAWVYKSYIPDYVNKDSREYCDKTLFLFAFGITMAVYVIVSIVSVFMCFVSLGATIQIKFREPLNDPPKA